MKKALLASAALALSSTFAFALDFSTIITITTPPTTTTTTTTSGGSTPPNFLQSFTPSQTIGDIGGKHAESTNFIKAGQTQFAIGGTTPTLSQTGNVTQTIGNNTGGHAANKVILNQTQFSITP